ncbi:MAG TPA: hypothetical protein VGR98_21050 [Streptosporangiaceae bacterium]|nr:hypothetical protein [Streptosporangiaceae bacterium]
MDGDAGRDGGRGGRQQLRAVCERVVCRVVGERGRGGQLRAGGAAGDAGAGRGEPQDPDQRGGDGRVAVFGVDPAEPRAAGHAVAAGGPEGIGARWALDQAGIATSVGPGDTATCAVYAGPQASAPYLVAQSYAGGGDAIGLAGYTLQPGEFVFAVWSGGTPASLGQLKVAGTKTVLAA